MRVQTYEDMKVEVVSSTHIPATMVGLACSITMHREPIHVKPVTEEFCAYLVDAEHMSLFEHVNFTFLIQDISRALLAQLTRHRTASPTSGSQHYQLYEEYPLAVHKDLLYDNVTRTAIAASVRAYKQLIEAGVAREEARMVLQNAATTNFLWTIDARNLFYFLRQRLCNRNVLEMQIFANNVRTQAIDLFPELFNLSGPQCFRGECKQGKLRCKEGQWIPKTP